MSVDAYPMASAEAAALWRMPRAANRSPLPGNSAFMLADWAPEERLLSSENPVVAYTVARRARLAQALPSELLVIPCGQHRARSNDTGFAFRPGTDHVWLTGNTEASSVLVIDTNGGEAASILYLHAPSGRHDDEFWQNDAQGDLWVGPRPSLSETQDALGIECRPLTRLAQDLCDAAKSVRSLRVLPTLDDEIDALIRTMTGDEFDRHMALKTTLDGLRLIKSNWEIEQLQSAVNGTVLGFEDCVREWNAARSDIHGERYIEATFHRRSRLEGEGPAYGSIVGSGQHATTLHWTANSGGLRDGDLVLMDMGMELPSLYAADVTRTLPVTGRFSSLQRDVYSIVLRAQQAGIDTLRAGVLFQSYQDSCLRVLSEGLIELGVLTCSVDEAMDPANLYARRWSISRAGHMLGMDVHDCNHAPSDAYLKGTLSAGNVLTVEPGLYFQKNDLAVPEELRGLGIRIEDDLVVTETSSINLSAALPREPDAVEAWMAELAG